MPFSALLKPLQAELDWRVSWEPSFLAETTGYVVALCGVYIVCCFCGRAYMAYRKPFKLNRTLCMWNLSLAVFSAIGAFRTLPFLVATIYTKGLYYSVCADPFQFYGSGPTGLWVTMFIFSKIPELLDTFFIVARKRKLSFLHWYHHVTVLLYSWYTYGSLSTFGIFFVAINYLVHAVMYFYYFLTALGFRPLWASLVTLLQLIQMAVGILVCLVGAFFVFVKKEPCHLPVSTLQFALVIYLSYFALFARFFTERFVVPRRKQL